MAFITKARKCDLQELASELGEEIDGNLTIANLRKLILNSNECEEEFVKGVLEGIVERRQEKENLERQEKERQFEIEKIKLQTSVETQSIISENNEMNDKHNSLELEKILQKFNSKNDDISLYLVIFERQAKRLKIDKTDWVTQLMPLLPSEVVQIIAREPEEESNVYEYVKELLLRRFKLSAETFDCDLYNIKENGKFMEGLAFEGRSFLGGGNSKRQKGEGESKKKQNEEKNLNEIASTSSNHMANNKGGILLQCVKVEITGSKSSDFIFSLLDNGSERTFVQKSVSERLGLRVIGFEKLKIYSFGTKNPKLQVCRKVEKWDSGQQCMVKTRSQATMADSGNGGLLALLAEMKKSMEAFTEEMKTGYEDMKIELKKGLSSWKEILEYIR
ncbi:hypothetical protein HNY73_003131 [Argiope bruennichi]|uniref:Peptidase aspartic putative domain-containing protein n=1 Tax=Argiope bruennichi TaxID=94029 RepID=A0A8T0G009_ARGBR|nr:hypothetical protein HNY73_003131 [Argiope bruennichi]